MPNSGQEYRKVNSAICPVCGDPQSHLIFRSALPLSVRSDWLPLAVPARVYQCSQCEHVFKQSTTKTSSQSQPTYRMFHNSPDIDKVQFETGYATTRSQMIYRYLQEFTYLAPGKRLLDFGCNRGAFLSQLTDAGHAGFDIDDQYRVNVKSLGYAYYSPDDPPPLAKFDVVTAIHVVEHLDRLPGDLDHAIDALKPGGVLFVQVPDPAFQPIDFYVADHCSHFSESTLQNAMTTHRNLTGIGSPFRLVKGELSALFRKSRGNPVTSAGWLVEPKAISEGLRVGEKSLLELCEAPGPFYIYGAGYLGSMVAYFLQKRSIAIFDDNVRLHGTELHGLPIIPPMCELRDNATIVIAVPPVSAHRVASACKVRGLHYHELFSPLLRGAP